MTFATRPEPITTLTTFYKRVRPAGGGWKPVAIAAGVEPVRGGIARNAAMWVSGVVLVYSIMFATGAIIFHEKSALPLVGATILSGIALWMLFRGEQE